MNRCKWWLCGVAVLSLVLSPVLAQEGKAPGAEKKKQVRKEGGKKGQKPAGGMPGDLGMMAKELDLTAEQTAKLEEVAKSYAAKLKENADKRKELGGARKEAVAAGNKEKADSLSKEIKQLDADRAKMLAEREAAIMGILNPQQKEQLQYLRLCRDVLGHYKRAKLTEEQTSKVKDLCKPVAKELSGLGEKDKKRREILGELHKKISSEILSDEQREKMKPQPREGKGEGKGKREGKGKGKEGAGE